MRGYLWCVTPGKLIILGIPKVICLKLGFQCSCVPRMGDGNAAGQLHGMAQRHGLDHIGFSNLWRGTPHMGCARVVDDGYVHENRAGRGRAARNRNPSVHQVCDEV